VNRRNDRTPDPQAVAEPERLQKVLARTGIASRRELERWIAEGRIQVNGKVAELGQRVGSQDRIRVDEREVSVRERETAPLRVLLYHKAAGEICATTDPEGRPTVFDALPRAGRGRWLTVGRLDFNTTGVLLFSNSGELAHRLMHPSSTIEREYAVRVLGEVPDEALEALRRGVDLDGKMARFTRLEDRGGDGVNHWYHVVLEEGRNREVHRLWETQGLRVSRLTRVRYGHLVLPRDLRAGRWKELEGDELRQLLDTVGLTELMPVKPDRPGVRKPKGAPLRARRPGDEAAARHSNRTRPGSSRQKR
jgi:23S rRNA pseudouridine2605 synthase